MAKLEIFYPIKNPKIVTQGFGENLVPIYKTWGLLGHNGIDMVGMWGQTIRAAHDGIVTYAGTDANEGWGIVIRTKDEREYLGGKAFFKSIYWHCQPNSFLVKVGDEVKCGQPIAKCGNTGTWGDLKGQPIPPEYGPPIYKGTHLHFALKPIAPGENDWTWDNILQENGYRGAVDPATFWNGMYAEDYLSLSNQLAIIVTKVAELFKLIFK